MSKQNARIRKHLAETCTDSPTKACFRFGRLEVNLDPDSPIKGVEFQENLYVSIYDPATNIEMRFWVPVEQVEFIENAL